MELKRWKKISTELKFKNGWWSYKIDKYTLPDGTPGEYHYAFTFGSVFIIPVTAEGKILLVKQYRYLNDRFSLEFPGGGVKTENDHDKQAEKELIEETGFTGELIYAGMFNPYNGVTNEICKVYIARNLKPSSAYKKDNSEEFEIFYLTPGEIDKMIMENEIYDGMTLASWALVKYQLARNI
ncbi:MAG TPA: NUDIX hydrolase [Ignavibacteria bacterium]|nr:NUDIX hydrolase [Ignavibacteria bacterium]